MMVLFYFDSTLLIVDVGCVRLTEITGWVVRQVPVKLGAVSLLQSGAQAKIRQLHVALEADTDSL